MLARVRTPSSLVREREREREKAREKDGEGEGERGRKREIKKWKVIIFKKNDGCLGTFYLSSVNNNAFVATLLKKRF